MQNNFLRTFSKLQFIVNQEIEIFFAEEIRKSKSPFSTEALKMLREFSLRGGKRIRPVLVNQGYFIAGGKNKNLILKTSIFIDLIHNFLLIHDDIMDKGELRRGKKTLHLKYADSAKSKKDSLHYGISMAIAGGDMMEFLARKILTKSKFPDINKIKAIKRLNQVLERTAYGQMLEFYLRDKLKAGGKITEQEILDVYKTKTALYTFVGPLQIGAILAEDNEKILNSLEKIGVPLGIAFQIKDDIQDIESDLKDKQPSLLILKNADECENTAKNLINKAKKIILKTNFPERNKKFLLDLADYIIERKD